MSVAIYVRVSPQRQTQTQTIDQQIQRLRAHLVAQGETLLEENLFRDDGYGGASLRRPGLDRLRDKAALALFDKVFVTDPDRLARNYVHQVLLLEELQKHGCQVVFLDRPMSQDPHDQLLLQIRGAVAEYERSLIAERCRRGRLHKFQTGQLLPWTRPPYGYRLDPEKPRDPQGVRQDPTEAAQIAEMYAWYLEEGSTLRSLVKRLNALGVPSPRSKTYWGAPSVRGILNNPIYTGTIYAGRTQARPARIRRSATHPIGHPRDSSDLLPTSEWIVVAHVPAIVSQEVFDRVQAKLATNQAFAARNNKVNTYLLRALVSCGECQLACMARHVQSGQDYYICTGKWRETQQRNGVSCPARFIPSAQLDALVWKDLCDLLRHPAVLTQALQRAKSGQWLPQEIQARRENLRRGLTNLQQQIERLTEAYVSGVIPLPEYQRRRAEAETRQQALQRQEQQITQQAARLQETAGLVASLEAFCQRVSAGLETATFAQKRQLVEILIDRVVVKGDDVEIRYVIPISERSEHIRFCHLRTDYFAGPFHIRRIRLKVAVEPVCGYRQRVVAVAGHDKTT